MKRAVFPGSFDPITIGHYHIVKKALGIFDEIIIAIGNNSTKNYLFGKEQRLRMIQQAFENEKKVKIEFYDELTVNFCKRLQVRYIIRGLRNSGDFEFEKSIAQMNQKLQPDIETVFFLTDEQYASIQSSIVREIYKNNGDIRQFLPPNVTLP
ncbi:MAG: phosphopantetheine adenylyltransferase [Bacteroidia bacterium]|nr:MAG: phosphopantetheine adenylyltransferase [Bacteroidia bacterium]